MFTGQQHMLRDYISFAKDFDYYNENAHLEIIQRGEINEDHTSFDVTLTASETTNGKIVIFKFKRGEKQFNYIGYEITQNC